MPFSPRRKGAGRRLAWRRWPGRRRPCPPCRRSRRRLVPPLPCWRRNSTTTAAPSAAKCNAMEAPMPLDAPVTMATLPASFCDTVRLRFFSTDLCDSPNSSRTRSADKSGNWPPRVSGNPLCPRKCDLLLGGISRADHSYNSSGAQQEKGGQVQFAGTARRVLRTNWTCPLFPHRKEK